MTFRSRLVLGGLIVAWVPLLTMGLLVRSAGTARLVRSYETRMEERAEQLGSWLGQSVDGLERLLDDLEASIRDDPRVRSALQEGRLEELQPLLATLARASGVDVAYVMGREGTILAASHFPGDRGRVDRHLAGLLGEAAPAVAAAVALPKGDVVALISGRSVRIGASDLVLGAGRELASVVAPGATGMGLMALPVASTGPATEGRWIGTGPPHLDPGSVGNSPVGRIEWRDWDRERGDVAVDLLLVGDDPALPGMLRAYDRTLALALMGAAALTVLLGLALSRRLSAPVERLAGAARRVHLGRLDTTFHRGGGRELDRLGYFLNGMIDRLRSGVQELKDAERRATTGELARQVNHDVRNGLVPIRNVLDHLREAHGRGADQLARAFRQRGGTLDDSVAYLDSLADQYRQVATHGHRAVADLNRAVGSVVGQRATPATGVRVVAELTDGPAVVHMDEVSLRRVVENLLANAERAVQKGPGTVRVAVGRRRGEGKAGWVLTVSDDGPGMPEPVRARAFEPFFTTRDSGTGLGLAIVRRLVTDVGGQVALESEEGVGTRVELWFPGAPTEATQKVRDSLLDAAGGR